MTFLIAGALMLAALVSSVSASAGDGDIARHWTSPAPPPQESPASMLQLNASPIEPADHRQITDRAVSPCLPSSGYPWAAGACLNASALNRAFATMGVLAPGAGSWTPSATGQFSFSNVPGGAVTVPGPWAPVIHQGTGGITTGHTLVWADQNLRLLGDYLEVRSANPGIATIFLTGAQTAGEQIGVTETLSGTPYTVRYTAQSSDTTLDLVATGLAACLANDTGSPQIGLPNPGAHCSATPSSLTRALLAINNWTAASSIGGGNLVFDVPLPQGSNLIGVSSAHMTVTTSPNGSTAGMHLDNGPYTSMVTYNPGRAAQHGDNLGLYRLDGQDSTGAIAVQYAGMFGTILDPTAGSALGQGCVGSSNGSGNEGLLPAICWSKGIFTDNGSGAGTTLSDPGYGKVHAVGLQLSAPPTSCSGQPTGTLWNNGGVASFCP